ncbi:MAG: leucine-rich repeat protein, partial [Clostridia bacterium]|nr:leucine-rich repeat protein [Clostridia bacterium]
KLPEGLTTMGFDIFDNCTALEEIVIPSSVTKIDRTIFKGCSSLRKITVEEGNTAYKSVDGVLYTKDGKTLMEYPGKKTEKEFEVPYGTEVIGDCAFYFNPYIVNINIPNSVKSVGRIIGCTALESIEFPESVEKIDGFRACSSLKNITLSGNIEAIPTYAFQDCTSLKSVVIPNGIKKLGNWVFYRCTSLESIVIPESVTDIGYDIFYGCTSIDKIYCEAESKPEGWRSSWDHDVKEVVWGYKGSNK